MAVLKYVGLSSINFNVSIKTLYMQAGTPFPALQTILQSIQILIKMLHIIVLALHFAEQQQQQQHYSGVYWWASFDN
jgi:hypothetical protein